MHCKDTILRTQNNWPYSKLIPNSGNNHFSAAKFRYNQEERPFLYQLPISEIENNSQISPSDQN